MEEIKLGRRERRRRKAELKMEGNQTLGNELQKTIENSELKTHVTQSLRKLVRRDTYTVSHSKSEFDISYNMEEKEEDLSAKSEPSRNDSIESRNLTYSLHKDSNSSEHCTYNIEKHSDNPPVPAPRKRKLKHLETEKLSSDTDRDITEIDLDDMKSPKLQKISKPSPISTKSSNTEEPSRNLTFPIPKPRKSVQILHKDESDSGKSDNELINSPKSPKMDDLSEKSPKSELEGSPKTVKDSAISPESNELPLVTDIQEEVVKSVKEKPRKQKKSIGDLMGKKKKSKTLSSLIKLEKKKIPKISSILKDLKEDESKENKMEGEENKTDLLIDSPHYKESAQNGRIYVQGKNGFHVMERDEVLGNGNEQTDNGNGGIMEDSTVKTAVLFQKYCSRFMTYFHGLLAGIGFCHAATVTAVMLRFNYQPQKFIAAYSYLSLKIHYVFYTLIALCIVSCCDRMDIGHMNRRHCEKAWKTPSTCVVTLAYIISFALTFANQRTESRFDALQDGNETEIWEGLSQEEIQLNVLQWYPTVWTRDVLVLFAWLVISLTKFDDFLYSHITNMAKYANINEEKGRRHKTIF